ncbi:MAG TPA: hypothetical protein VF502_02515 [Stellaceae bacterium]
MAIGLGAAILMIGRATAAGSGDAPSIGTDRIRLSCSFSTAVGAAKIVGTAKFCDTARTALKDLAAGRLAEPVTKLPAWAALADPDAEEECRRAAGLKSARSCDRALFRLAHAREPLPIVPVDITKAAIAEPGAITAILKGVAAADPGFGLREVRVSLKIITVANTAEREVELFQSERAIKIEQGTEAADSLRAGLQLLWASYFSPYAINHIVANAMAAKVRQPMTPQR